MPQSSLLENAEHAQHHLKPIESESFQRIGPLNLLYIVMVFMQGELLETALLQRNALAWAPRSILAYLSLLKEKNKSRILDAKHLPGAYL